jgi:ABC-type nitrate/sulfonate/bicarbonate transport system permease component
MPIAMSRRLLTPRRIIVFQLIVMAGFTAWSLLATSSDVSADVLRSLEGVLNLVFGLAHLPALFAAPLLILWCGMRHGDNIFWAALAQFPLIFGIMCAMAPLCS